MKIKSSNVKNLYFSEQVKAAMGQMTQYALTLVEAPMGYGKTTAVREHLKGIDARIYWQTIYDGYSGNFWSGFCNLFMEADEINAKNLLKLGVPNDSISGEEALKLIRKIIGVEDTIIVIDDYHLIDHQAVHGFIDFLIKNEIAHLNIIIMTRLVRLENLVELQLKGFACHIKKDILEMSSSEIMQYYKSCGVLLNQREVDALYQYTEGWVSALYVMMLEMIKVGRFEYELTSNLFSIRSIYSLVEKAIFKDLPENTKEFLICISHFDHFTLEQAEYIWTQADSREILDEILDRNVFVTYNSREKTYHIHNIMRNYLSELLEKREMAYKKNIYLKAGGWYEKQSRYFEAITEYYKAGDFDRVFMVVEADRANCITIENNAVFIQYFMACPQEIKKKHPAAFLIYTMQLFVFNQRNAFQNACLEFMSYINENQALTNHEKDRLIGEFEIIQSFTKYNSVMGMSGHHLKAIELLNEPSVIMDTKGAWTMGSPSVLFMFYRESGKLAQTVDEMAQAMPIYYKLTNDHGYGAESVMAAERYLNMGDYVNAEIEAYKSVNMGGKMMSNGIFACAMFILIRLAMVKGDLAEVESMLNKLHKDEEQKRNYQFLYIVDMIEAYVYAYLNQRERIPCWIRNGEINTDRILFQAKPYLNIVYGRVLISNGEYLKLIGLSDHFMEISSIFPNLLGQVYTLIYLAAANKQIFRDDEAVLNIRKALDIAMPDELYLPFVENGEFIQSLLAQVSSEGSFQKEISRICSMYNKYRVVLDKIKKGQFAQDKPKLTERESEIARLAAQGLTNKEIGERLFVSPNTIKTQLKSIFEKLEVNSRALLSQCFYEE